jgi:hypothetical protein
LSFCNPPNSSAHVSNAGAGNDGMVSWDYEFTKGIIHGKSFICYPPTIKQDFYRMSVTKSWNLSRSLRFHPINRPFHLSWIFSKIPAPIILSSGAT